MEIKVENLGVISEGKINIDRNMVNIKYGINGSGKSTVSKGIELFAGGGDLGSLRTHGSEVTPTVSFSEDISKVIVFNQDYVEDFLFKDDLANNSFEIMINTEEYKLGKKKIDNMFVDLVTSINNTNTKTIIEELEALINNVPIKKKETRTKGTEYTLSGSSKFAKARKVSNFEDLLDENARLYEDRLKSGNNHEWLKWFLAGQKFIEQNQVCPLCLSELPLNFENIIKSITDSVQATELKQNIEIKQVISDTEKYMSENNREAMNAIINTNTELSDEEKKRIYEIVIVCNKELDKLHSLRAINITEIKRKYEDNSLDEFLKDNLLEISFFENQTDEVKEEIAKINDSINHIITKSNELESITKDFSDRLNKLVEDKKGYINNFLKISGIPYSIDIVENDGTNYKTVLRAVNLNGTVNDKCLSFGERNAISLILFSLEACNGYDLIILDDPVSSFDNNKKFAILYYLFTKEDAVFGDKTVLLFTHDFDIIVDFIYKEEFKKIDNTCHFIKNQDGIFSERRINNQNIRYTIRNWEKKAENDKVHPLLRIVNLRKYIQYTNPLEEVAKNILSSLEHNDFRPMERVERVKQEITDEEKLSKGIKFIRNYINDFDYAKYLLSVQNKEELKSLYDASTSSIGKLQILRMIVNLTGDQIENQVFWDYLTEYYHVENNEMTSLDETRYDVIPDYIMNMSDEIIREIFSRSE